MRLKYSLDEYFKLIERLARQIYDSGFRPNQVVCIATGGSIVGMVLAKLFEAPLAYLAAESYRGESGGAKNQGGKVIFARHLAKTTRQLGDRVLLVDDLTDRGLTSKLAVKWLKRRYGRRIKELKIASIWHKTRSTLQPDFFVMAVELDENGEWPWIEQPLERYEHKATQEKVFTWDRNEEGRKINRQFLN